MALKAFGIGAFEEEDDDIYAQDNMSNYDIPRTAKSGGQKGKSQGSRDDLYGWPGPSQTSEQGKLHNEGG